MINTEKSHNLIGAQQCNGHNLTCDTSSKNNATMVMITYWKYSKINNLHKQNKDLQQSIS